MEQDNILICQSRIRQTCDICKRQGYEYEVVEKNVRLQKWKMEEKKKVNFKKR